jgi:hypothetical protein
LTKGVSFCYSLPMSLQTIIDTSKRLEVKYQEDKAWEFSPFKWIKDLPVTSKGLVGRSMIHDLLKEAGAYPSLGKRGYLLGGGYQIYTKLSLQWANGALKFQNIRSHDDTMTICLGLEPHVAHAWVFPNSTLWHGKELRDRDGLSVQHVGSDAWLQVDTCNVPKWMEPFGGTLDKFSESLVKLGLVRNL